MTDYIFLFDLDSTITKVEILPTVSLEIGKSDEMRNLQKLLCVVKFRLNQVF